MKQKIYGFWISPEAEIHVITNDFGHKEFIEKLLGKKFDSDDEADNSLFDDGWIRIVNGTKSFMVNYRCIKCRNQISAIKEIDKKLEEQGYFHQDYILDYGYDYHFFDSISKLISRIKERL